MKMRQLSKSRPGGMSLTAGQRPPKIRKVQSKNKKYVDKNCCVTVTRRNNPCLVIITKGQSLTDNYQRLVLVMTWVRVPRMGGSYRVDSLIIHYKSSFHNNN